MKPGEIFLAARPIEINQGRRAQSLKVRNTGDRPIQVGSHFHFFEVHRALEFERAQAFGMRLHILAGTSVRFEPGDEREVTLVEMGGMKRVVGFNGLVNGEIADERTAQDALERVRSRGFHDVGARE